VIALVAALAIAGLLYLLIRKDAELRQTTEMFERIVARQIDVGATESADSRRERDKLLTRIQAPEAASFMPNGEMPVQHISAESDEQGWETIKDRFEASNGG